MWVRFTANFDWPRQASAHRAFKAGMRCNLPRAGALTAIAEGKAARAAITRETARELKRDPYWAGDLAP